MTDDYAILAAAAERMRALGFTVDIKVKPPKGAQWDAIPPWIPAAAWAGYIEMRKARKKPPTPRAVELLVKELDRLRAAGQDIAAVLDQSTVNSWTDVYPVKDRRQSRGANGKFNFAGSDRAADRAAQQQSMAKHGITTPDDEVRF